MLFIPSRAQPTATSAGKWTVSPSSGHRPGLVEFGGSQGADDFASVAPVWRLAVARRRGWECRPGRHRHESGRAYPCGRFQAQPHEFVTLLPTMTGAVFLLPESGDWFNQETVADITLWLPRLVRKAQAVSASLWNMALLCKESCQGGKSAGPAEPSSQPCLPRLLTTNEANWTCPLPFESPPSLTAFSAEVSDIRKQSQAILAGSPLNSQPADSVRVIKWLLAVAVRLGRFVTQQ